MGLALEGQKVIKNSIHNFSYTKHEVSKSQTIHVAAESDIQTTEPLFTSFSCRLTLSLCTVRKAPWYQMHSNYHVKAPYTLARLYFLEGYCTFSRLQTNSGRMYRNECQSWALKGILFLLLLRNMDYEWGRDQTCCGFNMYESFHMQWTLSFIRHSRWGSGRAADTGEKQPRVGGLSPVLALKRTVFLNAVRHFRSHFADDSGALVSQTSNNNSPGNTVRLLYTVFISDLPSDWEKSHFYLRWWLNCIFSGT